jgi:L-malate glycosyltransferase
MRRLLHVLSGLEVGGKERVALRLAGRARREGLDHRLVLFDAPFRGEELDFDPGEVPVHFLPRRPGVDARFVVALARLFRSLQVEVVHAHNDTAIFYACAAASLVGLRRPGVCGTFHTAPGHSTRGARLLTRWAARRATVTAVSPDLARLVVGEGWVRRCESIVWNGVDLEEFTPEGPRGGWRERLGVPGGAILVGHVGRFDPVKRQEDLLDAILRLERRDPSVMCVLVGQGPSFQELQARAAGVRSLRLVPRVVDVASFLRELDVFVLCSEREAAPLVLLEAMACGRAVVATEVGGIPEILTDGSGALCGRLVPPRSPQRLAEAIAEVAADPALRAKLGGDARRRAEDFSAEREWSEYSRLYAQLSRC